MNLMGEKLRRSLSHFSLAIALFGFQSRARVDAIGNEFDGGETEAIAFSF